MRTTGAARAVVFCAAGLTLGAGLLRLTGLWALVAGRMPGAAMLGAITAILASAQLGRWSAPRIATAPVVRAMGIGCLAAIATLELATLVGAIPQLVVDLRVASELGAGQAFVRDIFAPMFWATFAGLVPAAVLGAAFGLSLRSTLRRPSATHIYGNL
jgi:hypothetical protein